MKNINEKKIIQNIVDKTGDLSRYKMPQGLEIIKGIGDDAAYWKSGDFGYCVTSDTLVENVHFKLMNFSADKLGEKAVAVNLSDIAAMGANPMGMLINLGVTNDITEKWINDFYDGITKLALKYNCPVIGGDIVKSEILNISVTCIGYKKLNIKNKNIFLNRESVNPGDLVYVSGYLGNSKAGLEILNLLKTDLNDSEIYLINSHLTPVPRIELGIDLNEIGITSCIDISDGLLLDSSRLADSSIVNININSSMLPISGELKVIFPEEYKNFALGGGEDYELLFTASPNNQENIKKIAEKNELNMSIIGEVNNGNGEIMLDGSLTDPKGWDHFDS
ncbi:MAG TPA: thiamine-phosphate kinase [Dehalococcoidia bacterium]|jgi:thiamine-monophosphate kinase|nr:thiamine-phosphate kinase [Dehalococcoidia bacterium]